jgi:CDP-diacylglycerol--glycerol-3-phosphate 3-phosphatidyltransferase
VTSTRTTVAAPAVEATFGPSALVTPANAVTIARLLATPVLMAFVVATGATWTTVSLWFIIACTDGVDGYIARRQGTTRSGAFLDPLADKVCVVGAMAALVERHILWWLPVVVIAGRETGLVAYRAYLGRRGVSMPASRGAKVKTLVQSLSVGAALLPALDTHRQVAVTLLWVAVVLTLSTGLGYLRAGQRAFAT